MDPTSIRNGKACKRPKLSLFTTTHSTPAMFKHIYIADVGNAWLRDMVLEPGYYSGCT